VDFYKKSISRQI